VDGRLAIVGEALADSYLVLDCVFIGGVVYRSLTIEPH
jgi:hypothetical protein